MSEKQENKPSKETEFSWNNPISEFLWVCAGVNRPVLRQCPTEWAKYAGIGGTILFTALMAMLSGGYALYTVFHDVLVAICFGIFWGLLIFNLDRFIVNTMYSDGKATISWLELASGAPRIIMAIFLGIVISTPLELKIFEDEINVTIGEMKAQKIREYRLSDETKRDSLRKKLNELQHSTPGSGINKDVDVDLGQEISKLNKEITSKDSEIATLNKKLKNKTSEKYSLFESLSSCTNSQDSNKVTQRINSVSHEIKDIKSKIDNLESQTAELNSQIKQNGHAIKEHRNDAVKSLLSEIESVKSQIAELDSTLAGSVVKDYEELVNKQYGGFQAHLSAFNKMKDENSATRTSAMFIMLLFVIIETAPTFFKMMLEEGPYDDLLRAEAHKIKILADKRISDINDEVNTAVTISTERNKNQILQQVSANKALLEQLSTAQSKVLEEAIELWKQEELKKVKENPSAYISMENMENKSQDC